MVNYVHESDINGREKIYYEDYETRSQFYIFTAKRKIFKTSCRKNTSKSIRLKIIIKYYNSMNKQLNLRNITRNGWMQETSRGQLCILLFLMTTQGKHRGNPSSFNIYERLVLMYKNPSYTFYRHQLS